MQIYYAGYLSSNPYDYPNRLNWDFHFIKSLEFYVNVKKASLTRYEFSLLYENLSEEELKVKFSEFIYNEISEVHKKNPISLFIGAFLDEDILEGLISSISNLGIVTLGISVDYHYGIRFSRKLTSHYNYILITNAKFKEEIKKLYSNPIHIDFASNPFFYYPRGIEKIYSLVFIGSYDSLKEEKLNFLYRKGIKVNVFGYGWRTKFLSILMSKWFTNMPLQYKNPDPEDLDYLSLLNKGDIYIDFGTKVIKSDKHQSDIIENSISLKDFEIPMSGSFYIRKYNEFIAEFYEEGKEIIFFRDEKELLDKIKFYLDHDEERKKIVKFAYKKAINEHTWFARIPKIFKELNLNYKK